ncbi:MAG: hypothetical protein P8163_07035 [Candidatus Thiodiazotropha sp.]
MGKDHILLVEGNPDDEPLALRAFQNSKTPQWVEVVGSLFTIDARLGLLKVVLLTSSDERQDRVESVDWALTVCLESRWLSHDLLI